MNTKRISAGPDAGGRRETDGNHEWTRIHTNLRRGFTSTDFADLGAETSHTGVATGFLSSWFENLAVASHPLQPDSFRPGDGENAIRRVEVSERSESRWSDLGWPPALATLVRATPGRDRPFPNALCIGNLQSNGRRR